MAGVLKGLRVLSGLSAGTLARPSSKILYPVSTVFAKKIHTGDVLDKNNMSMPSEPKNWSKYNDIVYSPQKEGEPARPAEVTHFRPNVKYSTKKLWYIAAMIRGMSIDEALKQLSFYRRKGADIVKDTLLEAQEMAVKEHNVEYKSNLWVETSFAGKALTIKGYRKHARRSPGTINYRFSHYFVRLREGRPPKHYYAPPPTGHQKLENKVRELRARRIAISL